MRGQGWGGDRNSVRGQEFGEGTGLCKGTWVWGGDRGLERGQGLGRGQGLCEWDRDLGRGRGLWEVNRAEEETGV